MKTSATTWTSFLGIAALLAALLAATGCEDDPRDLDYLQDASTSDAGE